MELIRGAHNILPQHHGCVLTIGNFDGVHLGHQAVIQSLADKGRELSLPVTVMTFEPQPQELFQPDLAPPRLCSLTEKVVQLSELAVARILCITFSRRLASMEPEQFVRELLVEKLGVRHLVVGDDFCFGKARRGDFKMLVEAGQRYGFGVESTQSFRLQQQRISSTLIRQALADGQLDKAATMLGRPYSISGRVSHGDKKGRLLGFPTANLALKRHKAALSGVFAVKVRLFNGEPDCDGVANIGYRPTMNGQQARLEVHLFDYVGDLYGQRIEVQLLSKLRDEIKFEAFEQLTAQIKLDVEQAKACFADGLGTRI
ncbi:bifunctional riboflavin kinase/FAD synthetase [Corallincola luteus]|uniref:Riboflavin biosynthesis protein n=1 Tax=Corallincola luteus TaxID=1775177 RepID=A0ABY2AJI8_9GAMM|nr:bifunctional riboflavin kinase/FAD synthetase [Corallincola luteus]TCI02140.1 bifunctional riboflavin kinase/FAD synthetase [Corallincola luteus]